MKKIKVMIIDDSAVVRQTLREIFSTDPELEVIATAADPIIAIKKLQDEVPDVIVLDLEMPRMDGLTFLKNVISQNPIPVVICSSKTEDGSQNAITALEYGAVDIIQKPKIGTKQFLEESKVRICDVVKAAYLAKGKRRFQTPILQESIPPKLTADAILSKPTGIINIETTEKVVVVGA